jgi:hypothetical protein
MLLLTTVAAGTWQGPPVEAAQATPAINAPKPTESSKRADKMVFLCGAKEFKTMKQLAAESTIVIRGRALSETTFDDIGSLPFVATTVVVTESFKGAALGAEVKVRQLAVSSELVSNDPTPVLQPGIEYVFFLSPSGLKGKADQYSPTSSVGVFLYNADGTADRLDTRRSRLPEKITSALVRQSVKDSQLKARAS